MLCVKYCNPKKSEVIVKFNSFYEASTRKSYISPALKQEHFEIPIHTQKVQQKCDVCGYVFDKKEYL